MNRILSLRWAWACACCFVCMGWQLSAFAQQAQAQVSEILTLEQAIQVALMQNYDIRIAAQQETVSANDVSYGRAGFYPTVTLTGSGSRSVNTFLRQTNTRDTTGERPFTDVRDVGTNSYGAGVAVSWTIFNGMANTEFYTRLELLLANSELQTRIQAETVIANVTNAYYALVQQLAQLRLLEETLDISEERSRIAQARKEVGSGSGLEALQSTVDLNADKSAFIQQQALYESSLVDLNELLGRDALQRFTVADSTVAVAPDLTFQQVQDAAMAANRSMQAARLQVQVNQQLLAETKARQLPTLSLVGGYNFAQSLADPGSLNFTNAGFFTRRYSYNVGLQLGYTLFDGGNIRRDVRASKLNIETAELRAQQVEQQVRASLARTFVDYRNNLLLIDIETANARVALQNSDIALERYKVGVSTPLELREAQIAYVQAQSRLLTAQFQAKLAETELQRLSGSFGR